MKYAEIKMYDIANGPGCRVSLFVSGCRRHCKGCFNEVAQSFDYGTDFTIETQLELLRKLSDEHIAGLSILGGEPFEPENRQDILELCRDAKSLYPTKDIWVWTGYLWENLKDLPVMNYIDVLIDGPFEIEHKDLGLFYRGSFNQRVIDIQKSREAGCAIRLEGDWR